MTRSRRSVLAGVSVGLAALAGCTSLDGGPDTPTFDTSRLSEFAEREVPHPSSEYPLSVTHAMIDRHRDRARELVEGVPAQPDVPNGAVAERLGEERRSVVDHLDEDTTDTSGPPSRPLRPLAAARAHRREAAVVEATYRAATDDISAADVSDRRAELRSSVFDFEREWAYRGDDPATAAVVHRELEKHLHEARSGLEPDRAFPADPTADVFGVGELVGDLELGQAAVADAGRLRSQYLEGLSDPSSYRTEIAVAAARLEERAERTARSLDEYLDPDPDALPFDRSIEGTPLERLYFRAFDGVVIFRSDAEAARHRGHQATALIEAGIYLTVLRALESVVGDIRNEEVSVPESVEGIEAARQEAVDALKDAWSTAPPVLAAELAEWAWLLVNDVPDRLSGPSYVAGETPDSRDAIQVWAIYVTAARVASAVPEVVSAARAGLNTAE